MRKLAVLALAAVLAGCVGNHAWRISYNAQGVPTVAQPVLERKPTPDCPATPPSSHAYRLAFIEFDDRGEFFERRQLDNALGEIAKVKAASTAKAPAAVVVFVHGWKNNAAPGNGNVCDFETMLLQLGPQFSNNDDLSDAERTHVLGIYIGWRGAVISAPVLKELTFFDRRDKSQNLPNAHLVETLLSIVKAAKGSDYRDPTFTLLVGHSFGGGLLESALTQTVTNIVLDTPHNQEIHWPADLTVLVNEASQATQSYQLVESMMTNIVPRPACGPGNPPLPPGDFYKPRIISITSTGDQATGKIFPIGQAVSRPFNSLRKYPHPNALGLTSQTPMYLKTTAHIDAFFTHVLDESTAPAVIAAGKAGCPTPLISKIPINGEEHVFKMVDRPGARNLTPYWVMQMPTSIVSDHSDIFSSQFRKLMLDLIDTQLLAVNKPYIRR